MDNTKINWWQAHRPTTRRLVQLYSALLHNAYLKGFIDGQIYKGNTKYVCVPGFNCYSCPGAVGSCPLGSIQNALASTGHRAGWYVLGIIMLFGVILGRTICGWLCPLGLIQELLHKIPTPKIRKSRMTRVLSWLKYVILAVFVVALPLWYGLRYDLPLPAFCKYICPAGTSEGAIGHLVNPSNTSMFSMLGILFTRKFVIMLVIGLACIFCYRSFCRFICPLGAIYGLFNRFNLIGVKVDQSRCNHCGACVRNCGMDVHHINDHECINCGKCMSACNQGAISIKAGKITLKAPDIGCAGDTSETPAKRRHLSRILWGIALAVLCFALLWFNVLEPSLKKNKKEGAKSTKITATAAPAASTVSEAPAMIEATEVPAAEPSSLPAQVTVANPSPVPAQAEVTEVTETASGSNPESQANEPASAVYVSTAQIGHEVGKQLGDFTLSCYDGTEFHLADTRGKIVFINFWATYCTPCKQELPFFSDLYKAHGDDIAMIAIHASLVTDDPVAYLADKDYAMPFATDTDDDTVTNLVGGTGTLPQTIVLNRNGEVIYNEIGSVTADKLEALYTEADASVPKRETVAVTAPAETVTVPQSAGPVASAPAVYTSNAQIGHEVGNQLGDFTLSCYDGSEFHLADTRGKIVFINFWATYCTPCKQELPFFSDLYKAHGDDIAMIAIHASLVTDDPVAYLADKNYAMPFATDTDDDTVTNLVGGTGTLPQTIVLNRNGDVIYNEIGSVTADKLDALYAEADASVPKIETVAVTALSESATATQSAGPIVSTKAPETITAEQTFPVYTSNAPLGHEVGNQLGDFTLSCYDGSEFHLADTRGKIVFINFWATYCTPCKQELPFFSDIYKAHGEDIAMIAIHASLVTDDPIAYLADKNYAMPFATDTDDDTVTNLVGGTGTLPQTIVLNRNGEIIYNEIGSVSAEKLEALYTEADASVPKMESTTVAGPAEAVTAPQSTGPVVSSETTETITAEPASPVYTSNAPLGHKVGNQLEDFILPCYDGSEFHLADTRGKIVFINFWATYCTPCKQELPFFSELYKAHGEDIAMIAIHASLVTDDPGAYLADKGYAMPFATDTDDDTVMNLVGGTGTLPQTIVLNRNGEVIYNDIGSVSAEKLDALYAEADVSVP